MMKKISLYITIITSWSVRVYLCVLFDLQYLLNMQRYKIRKEPSLERNEIKNLIIRNNLNV